MKILHVIHTPRYSGAEMLVCSLNERHASLNHHCSVVSLNPAEDNFIKTIQSQIGEKIDWHYPGLALGRLDRLIYLRNKIKEIKPDVIFMHSLIPAFYTRLVTGRKKIFVLHDANQNDHSQYRYIIPEKFLQFLTDSVIAVSEISARNYSAKFQHPPVVVIPNGIDLRIFSNGHVGDFISKYKLDEGKRYIVQIGRYSDIKRQRLSLLAAIDILKKNDDLHLLFIGVKEDPEIVKDLTDLAEFSNIQRQVSFFGPMEQQDIARALSVASVYLMPSSMEAHSVAMIEALASGVPIVCSKIPALMYAAKFDGVTLVSPEDVCEYSSAIEFYLNANIRFKRDLSGYEISSTADKYLEVAKHEN